MAKNTTATGSVIDGVTVVHPDNMGKGIKWNDTTKKYEVNVKDGSGLANDANDGNGGLRVVPADFIDNDTIVVDPTTGRIKVKPKACVDMTNGNLDTLSNGLAVIGQTCFYGTAYGNLDTSRTDFIIGIPADPTNASLTHTTAAQSQSQYILGFSDITGYQIASPNEVIQYFYDDYHSLGEASRHNSGWVRMHLGGVNPDGSLKNGSWTRWERIGAIPDPDGGISALNNRVTQLENQMNKPCLAKVTVRADEVLATMDDEMIVVSGGRIVHFDDQTVGAANVGKQWTIVNADGGATTLASSGTIIPPYKGSLKVKGANAVVTVVKTAANQYRVFGQSESA